MAITVVSTTPATGVTGHYIDHSIFIQFSAELEASYLDASYFKIYRVNASHTTFYEMLATAITKSGVVVEVNPTANLRPSEHYALIVVGGTAGIKSIGSDTMAANFVMYLQAGLTVAPSSAAPEIVPTVVLYTDGDQRDNAYEPSSDVFAASGEDAAISLVSTFPQDKSVGVTTLEHLVFLYNDDIDTTISIPINALSGRYNDLPMDLDPFGDRSLTITGVVASGDQVTFDISGSLEMANREYKFTLAPGVVKGLEREGYDQRTHEVKMLGPLSPVYALPDQILSRITGWEAEVDSSITNYEIWKLILEASLWVRDVYGATMTAENMTQVNKLTICLVLRDMFLRGFLLSGGIRSRTLLAVRVDYNSPDWGTITAELEKCIRDSTPDTGTGMGGVHIGIKSGRSLNNNAGFDTKQYGIYR